MKPLVAILTCHAQREFNAQIRNTWLREDLISTRFFMGLPVLEDTEDEVFLCVPDDFRNLWMKMKACIEWALEHGCAPLFKCDNDTYVHVPRLMASEFSKYDYIGYSPNKWDTCSIGPSHIMSYRSNWPAYGGTGYWLSYKAMKLVLDDHLSDAWGPCGEDWWVWKILEGHGIAPTNDTRYQSGLRGPQSDNNFITWHHDTSNLLNRSLLHPSTLFSIHQEALKIKG